MMTANPETPSLWSYHRRHLERMAAAALCAVDPAVAVRRALQFQDSCVQIGERSYALEDGGRVFIVGAGKAGVAMATAAEAILGDRIIDGVISVPDLPDAKLDHIRFIQGGHPIPTSGSLAAGEAIRDLLLSAKETDLVLALISGGGSALLQLPREGLTLDDLQQTNALLLKSGAPIDAFNTVRRHLSKIKGGGLLRLAAPAPVAALILSDVVGDSLESIASGPTVPATSKPSDALQVLNDYDLLDRAPRIVRRLLEEDDLESTDAPRASTVEQNLLIGSNRTAAWAAKIEAERMGFHSMVLTSSLQGEAREVGRAMAAFTRGLKSGDPALELPAALILGGETTVTVMGDGIGGRNQELALSAAIALEGESKIAVMALATDGVDGASPAAGAIVHGGTISKGRALGLDAEQALQDNDSYPYLERVQATIHLGPTGTNVNDLVICLAYEE